ncbi:unnamed protein product, partial [Microthlaspi erraticum]
SIPNNSKLDRVKPHNMGMVLRTITKAPKGLFLVSKCTYHLAFPTNHPSLHLQLSLKEKHILSLACFKAMLKQLLQGQADGVVDTSKKLAEINSKIENLNTRVYSLENHASSVAVLQSKETTW